MSRLTRTTEKLVGCAAAAGSSLVCMSISAERVSADAPRQPPAAANRHGQPALEADAAAVEENRVLPALKFDAPPNVNIPWFSRKKSRFSGKNRLKRVRLTCC